jgi:hypothetical protein
MSYFGRGSIGSGEVMRGECSGHFESESGHRPVWCSTSGQRRSVGFVVRKKKARRGPFDSERRGGAGWASGEAEAQWGGGELANWAGREVATAGPKTGAGPKFKK